MNLRAVIADDERIARQRLRRLLDNETDLEIVAECGDGASAVKVLRESHANLAFVDIHMPKLDGFGVLEAIGAETACAVVFVTAFDKHAVHAFDTCAIDYILKPVSPERLSAAITRAREYLRTMKPADFPSDLPAPLGRFAVRNGHTTTLVSPGEIDWIEADGNYAILHVGLRNHLLRETMAKLESYLPPDRFVRVSRSAIVRIAEVKEIKAGDRHTLVLKNGQSVPITKGVREIEKRIRLKASPVEKP